MVQKRTALTAILILTAIGITNVIILLMSPNSNVSTTVSASLRVVVDIITCLAIAQNWTSTSGWILTQIILHCIGYFFVILVFAILPTAFEIADEDLKSKLMQALVISSILVIVDLILVIILFGYRKKLLRDRALSAFEIQQVEVPAVNQKNEEN
ncbi:hypothetical protein HDU92_004894 [Lobulomyces angularis]|nr:hypothetical protein HDU92_004894 [Lobulomyces angularis]